MKFYWIRALFVLVRCRSVRLHTEPLSQSDQRIRSVYNNLKYCQTLQQIITYLYNNRFSEITFQADELLYKDYIHKDFRNHVQKISMTI